MPVAKVIEITEYRVDMKVTFVIHGTWEARVVRGHTEMDTRLIMLVVLGVAGGLLAPGCSSYRDPVTGEKATYGMQTLKARLDADVGTVYAAARKAAAELKLKVMRAAEDGISGEIRAYDAQRNQVEIRLGAMPEDRTLLAISVGPFGDKKKSIVLFEHIMGNLSQAEQIAAAPALPWGGPAVGPLRGVEP